MLVLLLEASLIVALLVSLIFRRHRFKGRGRPQPKMLLLHHGSSLTIEEARQHDLNLPPCYALSLVIPTYNEVKRLPRMLDEALPYFSNRPGLTEMLIVDDGSTDGTAELVHLIAKQYKGPIDIKLVRISTNAGKGNALIQGIMRAMGAAILFVDADGSTPIAELEKLESSTRGQGSIIICGSRTRTQSDLVIKSPLRRFLSTAFAIFLNAICYPQVQDSQCGFKLLTRRAAQLTVPQCTICGWAFDVELLLIARRVGVFVTEVPVRWEERAGSKMFLPRDSFLMAFDVLRMSLCDRIKSAWHQAP